MEKCGSSCSECEFSFFVIVSSLFLLLSQLFFLLYCSYDLNSTSEEREAVKTQKRLAKMVIVLMYIYSRICM